MKHQAYLVAHVNIETNPPHIDFTVIFSSSGETQRLLLSKERYLDIIWAEGDSFSEAKESLEQEVKSSPFLIWAKKIYRE